MTKQKEEYVQNVRESIEKTRLSCHVSIMLAEDLAIYLKRNGYNAKGVNEVLVELGTYRYDTIRRYTAKCRLLEERGYGLEVVLMMPVNEYLKIPINRLRQTLSAIDRNTFISGIKRVGITRLVEIYGKDAKIKCRNKYKCVTENTKIMKKLMEEVSYEKESTISKLAGRDVEKFAYLLEGDLYCVSKPDKGKYVAAEWVGRDVTINRKIIIDKNNIYGLSRTMLGQINFADAVTYIRDNYDELYQVLSANTGEIYRKCIRCGVWKEYSKDNYPRVYGIPYRRAKICTGCKDNRLKTRRK